MSIYMDECYRILVVDDDGDWFETYQDVFENACIVVHAISRRVAKQTLEKSSFDLVITNFLLRDDFSGPWYTDLTVVLDAIQAADSVTILITGTPETDVEKMELIAELVKRYDSTIAATLSKKSLMASELRELAKRVIKHRKGMIPSIGELPACSLLLPKKEADEMTGVMEKPAGGQEGFVWLHISDLHVGRREENRDWESLSQALIEDIEAHQKAQQEGRCAGVVLKPDLIFVTGDVAFSGTPLQYEKAKQLMHDIWKAIGWEPDFGRSRTFIVPGNHDCQRSVVTDEHSDPLFPTVHGILANQSTPPEAWAGTVEKWWGHRELRGIWTKKLKNFRKFVVACGITPLDQCHFVHPLTIAGTKVEIIGCNSALMSWRDNEDRDRALWIGKPQLREVERTIVHEVDVRFVLVHHPREALHACDPAYDRIATLADVVLHGHMHETRTMLVDEPERTYYKIAGGAANDGGAWHSQRYSYGRFVPATRQLDMYLRMSTGGHYPIYVRDNQTYPTGAPDGHLSRTLPRKR